MKYCSKRLAFNTRSQCLCGEITAWFNGLALSLLMLPVALDAQAKGVPEATNAGLTRIWSQGDTNLLHPDTSWGGAFSPDGKLVVTYSGETDCTEAMACVWDVATMKKVSMFQKEGCSFFFHSVFTPDGKGVLTSGGSQDVLVLWDPMTGREIRTFDTKGAVVGQAKYFPGGTKILTTSIWGNSPVMNVWDVTSGQIIDRSLSDKGGIASFDISPDGALVVTGDQNSEYSVRLWRTKTWTTVWEYARNYLGEGGIAVWDVAFSGNGKFVAVATSEECFLLEAGTGKILYRLPGIVAGNGVAFLPDDRHLLCSGLNGFVAKYEVATGKLVERTPKLASSLLSLHLSSDKTLAVMGSFDSRARIIGTKDLQDRRTWKGDTDSLAQCTVTPDGKHILTAHAGGSIQSWNAGTGEPESRLAGPYFEHPWVMQVAPDGRAVLLYDYAGSNFTFTLVDRDTGKARSMQKEASATVSWREGFVWAPTYGAAAIYHVASNTLSVLDLKANTMSPVDGLFNSDYQCRSVMTSGTNVFLVGIATNRPSLLVRPVGASKEQERFALHKGGGVAKCVAAANGRYFLVVESAPSGHKQLVCYSFRNEEASAVDVKALVASLGGETASEREKAQKRLASLGRGGVPFLKEAVNSPEPEISTRARAILAGMPDKGEDGRQPIGVVDLSSDSTEVIDLKISEDCRRWTAICAKSVMIGTLDEESGKLAVSAEYALPGMIANGWVLDDGRKCFTHDRAGMMTMWRINRLSVEGPF